MTIRDAAVADIVPKMTELEGYGNSGNPRLIYNLGHAVFEFIEAKFGKEGIRQFLFALRKSVIGGGEDAYEEAFRMKPDEFDQAFERYLKERFKPFRDKERPADYGRDLAPNAEKTDYAEALSDRAVPVRRSASPWSPSTARTASSTSSWSRPRTASLVRNLTRRVRQGLRVRPHRAARRPVQHDAVDVVVAEGRPARLLRPHREGTHAHRPERADAQDRSRACR